MSSADLTALFLSFKLALITVLLLLIVCIPIALWIAFSNSKIRHVVNSIVTLPLVLPPTVLGFYLLIFLNQNSFLGNAFYKFTGEQLTFSFTGLVVASMVYSLPFVIQPLVQSFNQVGKRTLFTAQRIGASRWNILGKIILPLSKNGIITASILGFVHTLGEFGVVLMIGGNIPESTRVVSIQIFNHVENLRFDQAHQLSLILLIISFLVILIMNMKSKALWSFSR